MNIGIADEVITGIAKTAVMETKGVAIVRKKQTKGIAIESQNGQFGLTIDIVVKIGEKVQEVAANVQRKVKTAVETMTGHTVIAVNVNVIGLVA